MAPVDENDLVERLVDRSLAERTANQLEYDWTEPSSAGPPGC